MLYSSQTQLDYRVISIIWTEEVFEGSVNQTVFINKKILFSNKINKGIKKKCFEMFVEGVALYGCKTGVINETKKRFLELSKCGFGAEWNK